MLEIVKQRSRRTRALLDNAQIIGSDGSTITLAAPAALAKMIAEDSNTTVLRDALTQEIGGSWQVAVEVGAGAPEPLPGTRPQAGGATEASRPQRAPEPDPRDDLDESEDVASAPSDPEADAMKLLQDRLGARPVE